MGLIDTVTLRVERFNDDMNKKEMSIDDLIKQECNYCYREVDASGLEAFRCMNKTVNMETSWCRPKNANEPCSICEYCKPREEMEMTIDDTQLTLTLKRILADMHLASAGADDLYQKAFADAISIVESYLKEGNT